jgi:hypothetical protein
VKRRRVEDGRSSLEQPRLRFWRAASLAPLPSLPIASQACLPLFFPGWPGSGSGSGLASLASKPKVRPSHPSQLHCSPLPSPRHSSPSLYSIVTPDLTLRHVGRRSCPVVVPSDALITSTPRSQGLKLTDNEPCVVVHHESHLAHLVANQQQ